MKNQAKKQQNSTQYIPEMLFSSAEGFYQAGFNLANSIQGSPKLVQKMVPAMMNLSFAIELLLKGLQVVKAGNTPYGHSFVKLFENVDPLDKQTIQLSYDSLRDSIPDNKRLPAYHFAITRNTQPKEETDASEDLSSFLINHDLSFQEWRYFFEYGSTSKSLYANFHLMDCFIRSLIAVISVKGYQPAIVSNSPLPY